MMSKVQGVEASAHLPEGADVCDNVKPAPHLLGCHPHGSTILCSCKVKLNYCKVRAPSPLNLIIIIRNNKNEQVMCVFNSPIILNYVEVGGGVLFSFH